MVFCPIGRPIEFADFFANPFVHGFFHGVAAPVLCRKIQNMPPVGRDIASVFIDSTIKPLSDRKGVIAPIPANDSHFVGWPTAKYNSLVGLSCQDGMDSCGYCHVFFPIFNQVQGLWERQQKAKRSFGSSCSSAISIHHRKVLSIQYSPNPLPATASPAMCGG